MHLDERGVWKSWPLHFLLMHLASVRYSPRFLLCLQRIGTSFSFPWFDSSLCIGVILHGISDSNPEFNFFFSPFRGREVKLSSVYLLAGYYTYLSGLALAPYRAFYAMAAIGVISFAFRIIQKRNRVRKHSHRHWIFFCWSSSNGTVMVLLPVQKAVIPCCTMILIVWWL